MGVRGFQKTSVSWQGRPRAGSLSDASLRQRRLPSEDMWLQSAGSKLYTPLRMFSFHSSSLLPACMNGGLPDSLVSLGLQVVHNHSYAPGVNSFVILLFSNDLRSCRQRDVPVYPMVPQSVVIMYFSSLSIMQAKPKSPTLTIELESTVS